jgi:carbon monoxide dehydrogenase subunit G
MTSTCPRGRTVARYTATVFTSRSPDEIFEFTADLRNLPAWDPSVRQVKQVTGDGPGTGSVFDVTVNSGRRTTTFRYRTVTYRPPQALILVAETWMLRSEDRVDVSPTNHGSTLTYDARLDLRGPLALADRWLQRSFNPMAERAAQGLRQLLGA